MALGQTLRYYRGQFNPEAAYQSSENSAGIISMYNPQAEAQFIDAVAQRQGRFDASIAAVSAEKARIGETETYDLAELNNRLKSFESGINELVKSKYNGDYSAAANEIAKRIGTERTNPFYHFNKEKVQMGKAYLDAKMKLGVNFLSAGNPFNVSFQDWQNGKTFEFTPINSADITQRSASAFQNLAKTMRSDPRLRSVAGGQYFEYITNNGFKNEAEAIDFIKNNPLGQQMVQQIYDSMPELQGVDNQEAVEKAITQGAFAGIGNTDSRLVADQSYLDALQQSRMKAGSGTGYFNVITPSGSMATKKYFKGENEAGDKYGAVKSFTINNLAPSTMSTQASNELETLTKNLGEQVKLLSFGKTPSSEVVFIGKRSDKNVKQMDGTKPLVVTDIGFSPNTPELVVGVTGYNADGQPLESVIALNAGKEDMPNNKVLNILPFLMRLGGEDAEFNREAFTWLIRNYPQEYQRNQINPQ